MSAQQEDKRPIDQAEVRRRCNALREANEMSRAAWGELQFVKEHDNRRMIMICTTKHTVFIEHAAWEALGERTVDLDRSAFKVLQ